MSADDTDLDSLKLPEKQLCTSCTTPNDPSSNFCVKCGAPLSSYAGIAPFEHLFAEGFIYRQAAERPRKLITVLGIWLMFGIFALSGLAIIIAGAARIDTGPAAIVTVAFGAFLFIVASVMIWKTTRNYLTRNKIDSETDGQNRAGGTTGN